MNHSTDFTTGSITKKMLRFMIPILGSLVLQAMYGAVDLFVVGRFGSIAGLSGVSTGSNVLNLVTFVIVGLAMGVTVLIGRYLGEKQPEKIGKLIGGAIAGFSVISIVLCAGMLLFAPNIAQLMQSPKESLDLTIQYIRICGGGIFFIVAYNVISSIFRGLGDSHTPLLFVWIACIINIIGDLFFVAGLHMNVAGAALATVLAQAVSVILSIQIMRKRDLPFVIHPSDIRFHSEVKRFIMVGLPLALQELLTQISFMALCAFINRLGLEASSGYGVASKIVSFVMLVPSALMQSMASFVSQNVGAAKEDRARKAMVTGMLFGLFIGIFVYFLIWLKGDRLSGLFTNDPVVVSHSWDYLKGFAPEAIVTALLFSFIGYFNGHQKTLFVMLQGIAQTFMVRLPVAYIMSIQTHASLMNIGLAAPAATVFGIGINTIFYFYLHAQIKKYSSRYDL